MASPQLYDQTVDGGQTSLLVEEIPGSGAVSIDGSTRMDLPRNRQLVALVGDPRNDENLVVSQLQLAFLRFHNRVLADVKADLGPGYTRQELFAEAQRVVRWHYQWLVLHEFLPTTVGQALVDDVLANGLQHYHWRNDPFIPVEFSVAAYRFGHSQVRPSYRANFATSADDPLQQFFALFLDPAAADPDDPADLRGGRRAPRRFIDWQTFFDFGDGRVRPNKRIDTKLLQLPELAPADLQDLEPLHLERRTPLWFYVLREAEVTAGGEHLGPVGGRRRRPGRHPLKGGARLR